MSQPFPNAPPYIEIRGAREHNLDDVDVRIPRDQLVVITGLSGSGKSTLAFDTLYAEGQRRYVESLSAYARQFLDQMTKPDVDAIEGLSPAIAIEQKTASQSPRSTVGTVTEIYDYVRLCMRARGRRRVRPAVSRSRVRPPSRCAIASWRSMKARASSCGRRSCAIARGRTRRSSPSTSGSASCAPSSTERCATSESRSSLARARATRSRSWWIASP